MNRTDNPYHVECEDREYKARDLQNGFKSRTGGIQFNWCPRKMRSESGQRRMDQLEKHLREHGMINPLITYDGHVLIGMRRFEIMSEIMGDDWIVPCIEVLEDIHSWTSKDVTRFQNWKTYLYGDSAPAC